MSELEDLVLRLKEENDALLASQAAALLELETTAMVPAGLSRARGGTLAEACPRRRFVRDDRT